MRYDHFCMLEESEKKFLEHHHGKRIPDDGCICRPHSKEAKRHRSDTEYTPKWKGEKKEIQPTKCTYPECVITSNSGKIILPCDEKRTMFSSIINITVGALCDKHYQLLYRELHEPKICAGCGAKP